MNPGTASELFMCVLQHMKCIEVRLDYAVAVTSQKQKYALAQAQRKVQVAINHLCDLLPDSDTVIKIKTELEKPELVYVMLLTEKFSQLNAEELEEVDELLEDFITKKQALKTTL